MDVEHSIAVNLSRKEKTIIMIEFDYSKIDSVWVEDIDFNDVPDFVDTYIDRAEYNGEPMTEEQLDDLNDNHREFVHESTMNQLH